MPSLTPERTADRTVDTRRDTARRPQSAWPLSATAQQDIIDHYGFTWPPYVESEDTVICLPD